ncbi:hypothetical protein HU200_026137 [Digitaria exilis]|uniref:Uncharacterized protein n=1 Tax=Digitaria exilis TaxID=1010633 RepID=A0A835BZ74_9POAL|nr:hypothetical protein HU200_026137 [Digitaria exilis]
MVAVETSGEWRRHQQGTARWVVEVASTDERSLKLLRWAVVEGKTGKDARGEGEGGVALLHFHATEEGNLNRVPVVDAYCTSRRFHATSFPYNYGREGGNRQIESNTPETSRTIPEIMASDGGDSKQCEACRGGIGLWQAAFTSECAHTFHLRCVSGIAACPVCAARWSHAPATGPAPAPSTPFSFFASNPPSSTGMFGQQPSSTPGLFGQSAAATVNSFCQTRSSFGAQQSSPPSTSPSFGAQQASPPLSTGRSLFAQQAPATTPNPFWLHSTPPATPSCAVCHGAIGGGQATVTSECSHTFHLRCFSGSVCPVCGARWRDEVTVGQSPPPNNSFSSRPTFQSPATNTSTPPSVFFGSQPPLADKAAGPVFHDDEPVERTLDGQDNTNQEAASNNGVLALKTHCEHPAVARDTALDNFAVLVHIKAPATATAAERTESERAPLDLVTVLDVSGSMEGPKLTLLKQAMGFVIDQLGPGDRLSIVTFSSRARRIIRLSRMTDGGKALAKAAALRILEVGLRVAAEVLDGRRHKNAVASVILLSDGHDNHTLGSLFSGKSYDDLVPRTLRRSNDNRCPPVHTFGFGTDHDAAAMHAIAEVTGGTFSFIQNHAVVQDSFAQCIGGLLSVAVQEARVAVECLHPGVRVRTVKSGRYESHVDADGRAASVDAGELYADEERRFLLFLDVPVAAGEDATPLIKVSVTYKDAATGRSVDVTCEDAMVQRPVVVADMEPCVEVARELFRVEAAEDIAAAKAAAERGEHAKAAQILDRRREASATNAGLAGDERSAELVAELRQLSARVADRREYEHTGRACMLAGMSSHAQQRAATSGALCVRVDDVGFLLQINGRNEMRSVVAWGNFGQHQVPFSNCATVQSSPSFAGLPTSGAQAAPSFGNMFATPTMQSMVASSRKAREQQQTEQGGSLFGLNSGHRQLNSCCFRRKKMKTIRVTLMFQKSMNEAQRPCHR